MVSKIAYKEVLLGKYIEDMITQKDNKNNHDRLKILKLITIRKSFQLNVN